MKGKIYLKKLLAISLSSAIALGTVPFRAIGANSNAFGNVVYVDADGKENASGSIGDPFSSIEAARDYLRKSADSTSRKIIYIREGVYKLSDSIEFTEEDSYITVAAYRNEAVEITGSASLNPASFKKLSELSEEELSGKYSSAQRLPDEVRDKVYVYDMGAENIPVGEIYKNGFNWPKKPYSPELVVNGRLQTLARYPNGRDNTKDDFASMGKGGVPRNYFFDKVNGTEDSKTIDEMLKMEGPRFEYTAGAASKHIGKWAPPAENGESRVNQPLINPKSDNTKYETDGWIQGYMANEYADDAARIYSVYNNNINCKYPSMYGASKGGYTKLYASNLLCELDTEEEYYIDRANGRNVLYYYPKEGVIEGKSFELTSMGNPLVKIKNASGIVISGIKFSGTTGNGMELLDCNNCTISGSEFCNISMDAIRIGANNDYPTMEPRYTTYGAGHNNLVYGCKIHDMGGGGVYLAGGDRKSLERGGNRVEHSEFYNFSRLAVYTPAIYMEGMGNTALYNYMHDAPHMALQIMGNDMTVSYNKFERILTKADDLGAIYAGREFTWLGNEISYNYFGDITNNGGRFPNQGIFMDDSMSGMNIHHNLFYNNSVAVKYWAYYGYNRVSDNVMINVGEAENKSGGSGNEKTLALRFMNMLLTENDSAKAGRGNASNDYSAFLSVFHNTEENINRWYEHYEKDYPGIRDWTAADGSEYSLFDDAARNKIGSFDKNVYVNVSKKSGDVQHTSKSVSELGIDMSTGRIDGASSSLLTDANYGSEWIDEWNKMSLENVGTILPADKKILWQLLDIMYSLNLEKLDSSSTAAILDAEFVSADAAASQTAVDEAVNSLFSLYESINADKEQSFIEVSEDWKEEKLHVKYSAPTAVGCDMYIALYAKDGSLCGVYKNVIDKAEGEVSFDASGREYDTVKAFLWDGDMTPQSMAAIVKYDPKPTPSPTPAPTPEGGIYSWDFSSAEQLSDVNTVNIPYKTGSAVYSASNSNVQLSNGGIAVEFDPKPSGNKVTIEFDLHLGAISGKSTGYTIDSSIGNILTASINEYSTSSSYINVDGARILGGETLKCINKVNGDGMGAKATHFKNVIDLANGIAAVTISNGSAERTVEGKFTADDISKLTVSSNHASRYTYLDNINVKLEESVPLDKALEEYAD